MAIDKWAIGFFACGAIPVIIYCLSAEPQRTHAAWAFVTWTVLAVLTLLERWWRRHQRRTPDR